MKNKTRHTGILSNLIGLPSSKQGNPRYSAHCDGVNFKTAPDTTIGYSIASYDGKNVQIVVGSHYGVCTIESIKEVTNLN